MLFFLSSVLLALVVTFTFSDLDSSRLKITSLLVDILSLRVYFTSRI